MELGTKKRRKQRLTLVCQRCKRRRIKCDKLTNCSNCVKANAECIYEDTKLEPYQQSAERPITFDITTKPKPRGAKESKKLDKGYLLEFPVVTLDGTAETPGPESSRSDTFSARNTPKTSTSSSGGISPGAVIPNERISLFRDPNDAIHGEQVVTQKDFTTLFHRIDGTESKNFNLPQVNNQSESHPTRLPSIKLLSTDNKQLEFNVLRVGENPYNSSDESIKITERNNIPFSFESFMNMEPFLKVLLPENSKLKFNLNLIPYQDVSSIRFSFNEELLHLNDQILLVLPQKDVFWSLLDVFFTSPYKTFPYVIKSKFYSRIHKILGPQEFVQENFKSIKIKKKGDYLNIALSLMLIKFGHMSLFVNKKEANAKHLNINEKCPVACVRKRLMEWKFPLKTVRTVSNCLSLFITTKQTNGECELNFELFLLLNYIKWYYRFAAESDSVTEGFQDMQRVDDLIVDMSRRFGFFTKKNLSDIPPDEYKVGVRIAIFACCCEVGYSSISGDTTDPLTTFLQYGEFPTFDIGDMLSGEEVSLMISSGDIDYIQILQAIVTAWNDFIPVLHRHFLELMSDKTCLNIKRFAETLSEVELESQKVFGTCFDRFITEVVIEIEAPKIRINDQVLRRIFIGKYLLALEVYYIDCYAFLSHHYTETNRKLAFFYFEKRIIKLSQLFKILPAITVQSDYSLDFLLNTAVQGMIFKVTLSFIDFLIKLRSFIKNSHKLPYSPRYVTTLKLCYETFLLKTKLCLMILYEFVPRYFYSWKIFRILWFYFTVATSEEFYERILPSVETFFKVFEEPEIDRVLEIASIDLTSYKAINEEFNFECNRYVDRVSEIHAFKDSDRHDYTDNGKFNDHFPDICQHDVKWLNFYRTYSADQGFNPFDDLA